MGMMLRRHLNKPNEVEEPEKVVEVIEPDTAEVEEPEKVVEVIEPDTAEVEEPEKVVEVENTRKAVEKKTQTK